MKVKSIKAHLHCIYVFLSVLRAENRLIHLSNDHLQSKIKQAECTQSYNISVFFFLELKFNVSLIRCGDYTRFTRRYPLCQFLAKSLLVKNCLWG